MLVMLMQMLYAASDKGGASVERDCGKKEPTNHSIPQEYILGETGGGNQLN